MEQFKAVRAKIEKNRIYYETCTKTCEVKPPPPPPVDCDKVAKELCEIDHQLVDLYNAKFGLRRLHSKKQKRCPSRRQLQQVKSLTLNTEDENDKKILDLLKKRSELQAKKAECENKKRRLLKFFKDY